MQNCTAFIFCSFSANCTGFYGPRKRDSKTSLFSYRNSLKASLDMILSKCRITKVLIGLSLCWSQSPKTGFLAVFLYAQASYFVHFQRLCILSRGQKFNLSAHNYKCFGKNYSRKSYCILLPCRMSENCKSLILQDKCILKYFCPLLKLHSL